MSKRIVALVGRPNVGKSTLFNRMVGERLAVVDARPGTTRDRLVADAEWRGVSFDVVDTGGVDPFAEPFAGPGQGDGLGARVRAQAEQAAAQADVVLFLVDGGEGLTPADHEVARILRRQPPRDGTNGPDRILLIVNKCDNDSRRAQAVEFFELGLGEPFPVSALHGRGVGDLMDVLLERIGPALPAEPEEAEGARLAILGRQNVGKSSLLNRLLGEERVIVSAEPGTTRDAVDTPLTFQGTPLTLIDTAGIRRRGRIVPGVERYSVLRALRALERAEVVLLVLDGGAGLSAQDAHIAGLILEKSKSIVVLVNKTDLLPRRAQAVDEFAEQVRARLRFLDYVPILFISATTGLRVGEILPLALRVRQERLRRIPDGPLNALLGEALDRHPPPGRGRRPLRITLAAQVGTDPPTFAFQVNDPRLVHFSYVRYLENALRDRYGFLGTPLRLTFQRLPPPRQA